ncbi:nucleotidyltransferase domain-containing protein [Spirochaeta isovalerica]|uniref:Putative nucleotidyltransferase n=1 Tax=Spirochaeta isovalerica TaxID=150 RepID=A0A841RIB2_9SPIO|nr:nucleotidyltransferase domain-containing protein [Spirochaeta isovalerica]MBB6482740.1 putative nucleotidyltransferase [Spirochaeta isovalerica]
MKAIEELIPKLNNSQEFQPLIDTFIESIQKHASEIHSIYMCGSIPKGTAVPYESDADFTVVLKRNPTEFEKNSILNLTVETQNKFNIVTKIDVPICTVQDVLSNPYDWGFWVKIVSICIFGPDLSNQVPNLYPSPELQKTYFVAAEEQIPGSINIALTETDDSVRMSVQKKSIKKIIRAVYSLYFQIEESWTEDINEFISTIERQIPKGNKSITELIQSYHQPELTRKEFKKITKQAMDFYYKQYTNIINDTT